MAGSEWSPHPGSSKEPLMDLLFPPQTQAAVVFHQVMMTLQRCCGTGLGFFRSNLWFGQHGIGPLSNEVILQDLVSPADFVVYSGLDME